MDEFDLIRDRIVTNGLGDDETMGDLVDELRRTVIEAALTHHRTTKAAAYDLGMSREGLGKMRKRLGIGGPSANQTPTPIPTDWRERLNGGDAA